MINITYFLSLIRNIVFLQEVQRHLVYYKRTDIEAEFGMELYSELPSNRLRTLREADAELWSSTFKDP